MFVEILSPVKHDGKLLRPGDKGEMDDKQALILIDEGIVKKAPKPIADSKSADNEKPLTGPEGSNVGSAPAVKGKPKAKKLDKVDSLPEGSDAGVTNGPAGTESDGGDLLPKDDEAGSDEGTEADSKDAE
ncbi:MAG: hypothetical protein ACXWT1_05845 [Methylobacter sp.]